MPTKESGSIALEHCAARTQESCVRRKHLTERDEVVFVTAGPVQEQQRAPILRLGRHVSMNVGTERVTIHQRSM
jgi:hypothetical protein